MFEKFKTLGVLAVALPFFIVPGITDAWAETSVVDSTNPSASATPNENTEPSEDVEPVDELETPSPDLAAEPETPESDNALEIAPEAVPQPVGAPGQTIVINSFDDLKPHLSVTETFLKPGVAETKRTVLGLEPGNYQLAADLSLNTQDPYFADKQGAIAMGLFSFAPSDPQASDANLSFDGKGHSIKIVNEDAVSLFGTIHGNNISISNLDVEYAKNVSGHGFVQRLIAGESNTATGKANGLVSNVTITIPGDVKPQAMTEQSSYSNNFVDGQYQGDIATGFAWYLDRINIDDLKISVAGNIGSDTPPSAGYMSSAFGLTFHCGDARLTTEGENQLSQGNDEVLKDLGRLINFSLDVNNIIAHGNYLAMSAGLGHDMGETWVDNAVLNVKGDIKSVVDGNGDGIKHWKYRSYAAGFSEEVRNLTNSKLDVSEIALDVADNIPNKFNGGPIYGGVFGIAYDNSKGYLERVSNNTVNIGKMQAKAPFNVMMSAGFFNTWNSYGDRGIDFWQEYEKNTITVGDVNANVSGNSELSFLGLGERARTGKSLKHKLKEVSAHDNSITVGDVNLTNTEGDTFMSLLLENAANAKNNSANYGDITIKSSSTGFTGLGKLQNRLPKRDEDDAMFETMAENNNVKMGNVTIETKTAGYISLLAGGQDVGQKMQSNTAQAKDFHVTITDPGASRVNWWVSGIVSYQRDSISGCHVWVDDVSLKAGEGSDGFFGLGSGFSTAGATLSDSSAFVHKNINVDVDARLWGGGFVGYSNGSTFTNNNFQVDGEFGAPKQGSFLGGFVGRAKDSKFINDSALMLNSYAPFAQSMTGGELSDISHYINQPAPDYWSGLLATGNDKNDTNTMPTVKNSTLLVERANQDTPLYVTSQVSQDSGNNWVTVVNNEASPVEIAGKKNYDNRLGYSTKTATHEWGGEEYPVVVRDEAQPAGSINIAHRSFQDKYWNPDSPYYEPANTNEAPESDFGYLDRKTDIDALQAFGVNASDIVSDDVASGTLRTWHKRHLGLRAATSATAPGPVFDLLGIKAMAKYSVTYNANGATDGSVPVDDKLYLQNDEVSVAMLGTLAWDGYRFLGWNTQADGNGIMYQPGDTFQITEDTVLYARWEKAPESKEEQTPQPNQEKVSKPKRLPKSGC